MAPAAALDFAKVMSKGPPENSSTMTGFFAENNYEFTFICIEKAMFIHAFVLFSGKEYLCK